MLERPAPIMMHIRCREASELSAGSQLIPGQFAIVTGGKSGREAEAHNTCKPEAHASAASRDGKAGRRLRCPPRTLGLCGPASHVCRHAETSEGAMDKLYSSQRSCAPSGLGHVNASNRGLGSLAPRLQPSAPLGRQAAAGCHGQPSSVGRACLPMAWLVCPRPRHSGQAPMNTNNEKTAHLGIQTILSVFICVHLWFHFPLASVAISLGGYDKIPAGLVDGLLDAEAFGIEHAG